MGQVAFGGYRISVKSKTHYDALLAALKAGCGLIDTSSNYTNGDSEKLIGKVLKEHPEYNPLIVSKAGYIQGDNLNDLVTEEELVEIHAGLKHSIHPKFLEDQISKSLKRLERNKIDIFLLHNPEYYFETENANVDEFYNRIEKALIYLSEEVKKGRIGSYGISSNSFILPHNAKNFVDFDRILELVSKNKLKSEFTHIQFPMNLIEIGALEKLGEYGDLSLLETAQLNGIKTIINRPLNAFKENQLIRLAHYSVAINHDEANKQFTSCLELLNSKWKEEHLKDGETEIEELNETTLIKQFSEIWNKLPTPDSVDQVYHGHIFPFIAQIWGGSLTAEESKPFYDLYDYSIKYSRQNMSDMAMKFREQAISVGIIQEIGKEDFAKEVIETYLNYGIDYVLVGMRKPEYVDQLKSLF